MLENSMQGFILEQQLLGVHCPSERPMYLPYKEALRKATRLKKGKLVELLENMGLKAYYSRTMDFYHGVDVIAVDPEKRTYVTLDISVSAKTELKADVNIVSSESSHWRSLVEQALRLYAKML